MSKERNERGLRRWMWDHQRGLFLGALGAGAVSYGVWRAARQSKGELPDPSALYEQEASVIDPGAMLGINPELAKAIGLDISRRRADETLPIGRNGNRPNVPILGEHVRPQNTLGQVALLAVAKEEYIDGVARSGGQQAIAYRKQNQDWKSMAVGENGFIETPPEWADQIFLEGAVRLPAMATHAAIGWHVKSEGDTIFQPTDTVLKGIYPEEELATLVHRPMPLFDPAAPGTA